ncbi:MAG: secretin N-terminal domain-containing protein [Rhodocyclaceae bacterium]|nr:secretin N-terminal domain-containing protein [Rhodocyclaceae bacterium]
MKQTILRTGWLMAMPLLLAACGTPPARPDLVRERMGEELTQALNQRKSAEVTEKALLPPLSIELPKAEQAEPRFDLSVVNAPAAQVFMAIVSGTRYNMLVGPEVTGTITINLKDVTVREALESIRDLYGYEFTIKGNRIAIQPNTLQTRVFQVNYLASRRQGATELRVTSSSIAANETGPTSTATPAPVQSVGGGARTTGSLTSRVQTNSDTDFWRELQTSLATIVSGEGRSVVVNGLSGVVVVRAYPAELRAVEQYLKATQVMVERQVMLEAKILEVQLSERFQNGINWASFNGVNHRASFGVLQPGATLGTTGSGSALANNDLTALPGVAGSLAASALGNGFVGLAFQTANFAALLSFLETQGQVSVLSSPRIATLNNQKAVLKVGTDELFVTNVTSTTTSTAAGTTSTPNLTLQPYFSGISLDVTPQIDEEGKIILHIHPAISAVAEKEKIVDLGSLGTYRLPLATSSVNETDSIVRVQDGNIVAIGGLMTHSQTSNRNGLPGTVSSPAGVLFGQRGSSLEKRELVILLKPTIIRDDRDWMNDLRQSGERLRSFDLPPLDVPLQ